MITSVIGSPRVRVDLATQPYRGFADDHREAARPLQRNGKRAGGRLRYPGVTPPLGTRPRAFSRQRNLDQAVRSWAAEDEKVASIVAGVDARRIARVARLLSEAGVDSERAVHRATFLYWAFLGQSAVMDQGHAYVPAEALTEIIGFFEGLSRVPPACEPRQTSVSLERPRRRR